MARKAGIDWKAVGASLDTLAATMRAAKERTPGIMALGSSTVLQQSGVVLKARYIVDGDYSVRTKSGYTSYTAPPGATHGPVVMARRGSDGKSFRNERGQFVLRPTEKKIFVKGKFVDRSGGIAGAADDLATFVPSEKLGAVIVDAETSQYRKNGQLIAGIDASGGGYITLSDGYAAAERGSRGRGQNGVRGIWRALRSVQGRWTTIVRKRYPDLLKLPKVRP